MSNVLTSFGTLGIAANATDADTAILFLHGVGSDKSIWRPQLEHYRGRRTALAIDYPGYGESDFRPGATRDDFARAAFAALDAMGRERAHICGLSLGGVVAIAMHSLAPDRCASLILADTFAVHPDGQGIYDRSIDASRLIGMRALAEARVDVLLEAAPPHGLRAEVVETMAGIDPEAYAVGAEAVWLADQRERAAAIAVPTLVLCGEEDRITPPELSTQLAAMIPDAKLVMIEGAGHLANAERPDAFNAAMDRFLTEIG